MARSTITPEQWEKAREYFEHGLSLGDIESRTGITKSAISKKSKSESWNKESPKKRLLSQAVEVTEFKDTLKDTPIALEVHKELHDEKTRYTRLVNNLQEKALNKARTMLDQIDTPNDLKTIVEAVDKASITLKVSDRHAPKIDLTAMQQNNSGNTTVHIIEDKAVND
jgi:predicted DNA-binding protein YlxM (UPF0122 family)